MHEELGTRVFACDLSQYGTLRVSGEHARQFLHVMSTAPLDPEAALGSYSQGLLLNTEGQVVDAVTIVRTGDAEYLVLTSPANTDEVCEWLEAHSEIADDEGKVFGDLSVEDQSAHVALIALFGKGASGLHEELVAASGDRFAFVSCFLGAQWNYGLPKGPSYVLFVPANVAPQIGDFLNSHLDLEVVSLEDLRVELAAEGAYSEKLDGAAYVTPGDAGLSRLIRKDRDFVGARALAC